jgi:hypothetical protein
MFWRIFGWSLLVSVAGLALGWAYGGSTALLATGVLAIMEVSLSFDNAVVNASVLNRMSAAWQRLFLTVGIVIAVFGMRLLFPLLIVGVTAKLSPSEAFRLAREGGSADTPGTYANYLEQAHPAIAAFGGIFLLMLFLDFVFTEREITWLGPIERTLARIGRLDQLSVIIALVALCAVAYGLAEPDRVATVMTAGVCGAIVYIAVSSLNRIFESMAGGTALAVGRAAFFLFLYLEVLDASFSFDGVVSAFAITTDPIVIALGLGIGAVYIRSLTVFLVRAGTLRDYVYLEHGAMWAIGALAVILLLTVRHEIPEYIVGLIGLAFIVTSFASSVVHNRSTRP